ncbi:MAG: hypothetical protein IH614_11380 [Desulfuromonadales bacterium]|nr:hypothetical protein [Desulfuromonadales bacterium]
MEEDQREENAMRRFMVFFAWIVGLVLLVGCAGVPKQPRMLAAGFHELQLRRVTLAPLVFRDDPIDRYFAQRVGGEILAQTEAALTAKGYAVTPAGGEEILFPFGDQKVGPFSPTEGDDAVLAIEIDNFLDAVLYDRSAPLGLDIYATATLISRGGDVLWQDTGVGRGMRTSTVPGQMDWFITSRSLVQSLFTTFPSR